jgi:cytochrome c peroxidase
VKKKGAIFGLLSVAILAWYGFRLPETGMKPTSGEPATKEQLGEKLFFDNILSADRSISCASCHIPEHGFADTTPTSTGVGGRKGLRNTPSCANMGDRPYFFYDGRAGSLEDQVHFPIEDSNEMSLPMKEAVRRLRANKEYVKWFGKLYKSLPTEKNISEAIAAYERTLETSNTPFDRYMSGNDTAITESAKRGRELFMSDKAKCFDCHFSPDFTGDEFRNIGLFDSVRLTDEGRYKITRNPTDLGKFKVPGLRNVGVTAPYMHNGMFANLREVIEYYDDPYKIVAHPVNIDTLLQKPLGLTAQEKDDLEAFLHTLTDDRFRKKQ